MHWARFWSLEPLEHSEAFTYKGVNLTQLSDKTIILNQNNLPQIIQKVEIPQSSDASAPLNDASWKAVRKALGQLNWLAGISNLEISSDVCSVAAKVKEATVADALYVNKIITRVHNEPSYIALPPLDPDTIHV